MNWDAIGAIGEIVGALAVVISVIYLAIQVKGQTNQSKLAATRELAVQHRETLNRVIDDDRFSQVYLKAVTAYDDLPNSERIKVSLFLRQMFRNAEQQYLHIKYKNVDPIYFESMNSAYDELLTFPGVQSWWSGNRNSFAKEFRNTIDARIDAALERGYKSSFKQT